MSEEYDLFNVVIDTKYFRQWTAEQLEQLPVERLDEIAQQYEAAALQLLKVSVAATTAGRKR